MKIKGAVCLLLLLTLGTLAQASDDGKRAVLDTFVRAGIINFSAFERDVEFAPVDGDFAVIMGSETLVPMADAPAAWLTAGRKVVRRFTNIWKREADEWRLFWRHANVVPAR